MTSWFSFSFSEFDVRRSRFGCHPPAEWSHLFFRGVSMRKASASFVFLDCWKSDCVVVSTNQILTKSPEHRSTRPTERDAFILVIRHLWTKRKDAIDSANRYQILPITVLQVIEISIKLICGHVTEHLRPHYYYIFRVVAYQYTLRNRGIYTVWKN